MNLVNLTPHKITVFRAGFEPLVIEPTLPSARVKEDKRLLREENGFKFYEVIYGEVENLPKDLTKTDNFYIVSSLVKNAIIQQHGYHKDLIVPCDLVRDEQGNIVGCRGFIN